MNETKNKMDRILRWMEFSIALLVAASILSFTLFQLIWIWSGTNQSEERLQKTVQLLNENWKVGLLILVPLFYRTIRTFLEEVQEFMGMKRSLSVEREERATNPPKRK